MALKKDCPFRHLRLLAAQRIPGICAIKGNRVERRVIKTGIVTTSKVQVLQGLRTGEQVVTSGQLNLEQGTTISINN